MKLEYKYKVTSYYIFYPPLLMKTMKCEAPKGSEEMVTELKFLLSTNLTSTLF